MSDQPPPPAPSPARQSPPIRRPAPAAPAPEGEPATLDESNVIAYVESDRYCDSCGYNLITLPVFKDPRTSLFLIRCTECGAVHPAGIPTGRRPVWANRVGAPLLFAWMGLIGFFLFVTGAISTGMHAVAFEELTQGRGSDRVPMTDFPEFPYFVALVWGVACVLCFLQVTLLATVAHHWRRWGYFIAAIVLPMVPMLIALQAWRFEAPHLLSSWAPQVLLSQYGVAMIGGLIGAMFGRKIMRVFASLLLPPKSRQMVAFLWICDGLTPPPMPLKQDRAG